MKIDEPLIDRMKAYLDFTTRKQQAITSNLANSETPGYRAKDVKFEDVLAEEAGPPGGLRRTHEKHLGALPALHRAEMEPDQTGDALGNDRNDVDLDRQMTQLAENVLRFSVMGRLLQGKLQLLKHGIKEGRG